ncbi:hypothetical protein R1flu_015378 [Riccia fluitans]|uniref:Uncharacterized protein n=1 Tax=Riccia fluitans TaxID=41844 RepID=A0ABD1YIW4_9MARC
MAIKSFIRMPPPGPIMHPPHPSSSCSTISFPRRAFMSFGLSLGFTLFTDGQFQDAQALVEDDGVGLVNGQLRSCEGGTPCVSTSAFRSPSRFMPPWSYLNSKESAFVDLLKTLERMGAKIVETDDDRYVYATMSSPGGTENDVDDLEFLFVGNQVCFRSRSRKSIPDPPFCWWPGCINGPRNRQRMEALRDELGWIPMETDEEKKGKLNFSVPVLFTNTETEADIIVQQHGDKSFEDGS